MSGYVIVHKDAINRNLCVWCWTLSFTSHSSLEVPISQIIMWKRGCLDSVPVRRGISNLLCNILHVCGESAGKHWIKSMLLTASLFPFLCFGIGFFLNFIAIYYHSLAAIPFGTMVSHPNSGRFLVDQDLHRYVNLSFLVLNLSLDEYILMSWRVG